MPNTKNVDLPKSPVHKKAFVLHHSSSDFRTSRYSQPVGRLLFTEKGILHIKTKREQLLVPPWYCAWISAQEEYEIWSVSKELFIRNVYFDSDFCNNPCFHQMSIFNGSELFRNMIRYTEKWNSIEAENIYEFTFATVLRQMLPDEMKKAFHLALPSSDNSEFQQVLEYIHQHFDETLTVTDLVKSSTFSLRTLQRLFTHQTGLSFSTYLKITRICKAVELLSSTTMRVAEIAWAVGYNSIPTFNNTFRTITGYRPEHFQRANT